MASTPAIESMFQRSFILAFWVALPVAWGCRPLTNPPWATTPPMVSVPVMVTQPPLMVTGPPVAGQPTPVQPATITPVPSPPLPLSATPTLIPQSMLPPGAPGALVPPVSPSLPGWLGGDSISPRLGLPRIANPTPAIANPLSVPVSNDEFAWEQIADVVSDYFPIATERRARRAGNVWSEGFIETAPQGGASIFEPQRRDSVGSFNRWESTFQTTRRHARVRVTPDAAGYTIGVEVQKEIEDMPRPENATAGAATFRNDGSLPRTKSREDTRTRNSGLWVPLGRDIALEQRILGEVQERLKL